MLTRRGWEYRRLDPGRGLADQLKCVDALVWGNAWQVSDQQLIDVVNYVSRGGGLLLGGLGWSWQQLGPGASASRPLALDAYPANRLGAAFGFAFTADQFASGANVRVLEPEKSP